jgi:hypothetical protein
LSVLDPAPSIGRSITAGENSSARAKSRPGKHVAIGVPPLTHCSTSNGSLGQPRQRSRSTTYMRSVGKPSADSNRLAATSVYTSALLTPYFTLSVSPPGSSHSNFGVLPATPPGLNVQSTTWSAANPPGPGGFSPSLALSIGVRGSTQTCARRSASSCTAA